MPVDAAAEAGLAATLMAWLLAASDQASALLPGLEEPPQAARIRDVLPRESAASASHQHLT